MSAFEHSRTFLKLNEIVKINLHDSYIVGEQ